MVMTDPLGDMLTRIRNGQRAGKAVVSAPASRYRGTVLDVLQREGFIRGYNKVDHGSGKADFDIELKYFEGQPVIKRLERVSKPGRRIYSSVAEMPRIQNGLGVAIVSTSRGVMSDNEARDASVGGEVLCTVF
tara:strand:+ start:533 stop:931 length:399 start_codon:yes stop_codon:yes gene_type:complete